MHWYWNKNLGSWLGLLISATVIAAILIFANALVKRYKEEELKTIKTWATATRELAKPSYSDRETALPAYIIEHNNTIPLILTTAGGRIVSWQNLDPAKATNPSYLSERLESFKENHPAIKVRYTRGHYQLIYYGESNFVKLLRLFPYLIIGVSIAFVLIGYFTMRAFSRSEQNLLWAGMARETAHQIGTPLSSLLGWAEILKLEKQTHQTGLEIERDVNRLQTIAERFSKIGSTPDLKLSDLRDETALSYEYMKSRASSRIGFSIDLPDYEVPVMLNRQLYSWVIENLIRNAIDAMRGEGEIQVRIWAAGDRAQLKLSDTGRGIPKSLFKKIFRPGFTTKKRGWGLGLSLTKRIVELFHNGKISIAKSELNKGTSFSISFPLARGSKGGTS